MEIRALKYFRLVLVAAVLWSPLLSAAPVPVSLTIEPDILEPFAHDWSITSGGGFLNPPCTNVHNLGDPRLVTVGLSNGLSDIFEFDVQVFGFGSAIGGGCVTQVGLTAMLGALGILTIVGATDPLWVAGGDTLYDFSDFEPYNPGLFRYTLNGDIFFLPRGFHLTVPEPTTLMLLGLGLAGLGFVRRRLH